MPPSCARVPFAVFQAVVPGKQFSFTTMFEDEHERALGVTLTICEGADSIPLVTERTA